MMLNIPFEKYLKSALIYLLVVAALGLVLRMFFIFPMPFNFKYLLHAHSHVALLGWLYLVIVTVLIKYFGSIENKKQYKINLLLSALSVLGMLLSFPVQGYAAVSITFSTLHIFISWWFIIMMYRDIGKSGLKFPLPILNIKASMIFLAISSIGPFLLGILMANGGVGSQLYYLSVYYYLHFYYNGWIIFALVGLFFYLLDIRKINYSQRDAKLFSWLLIIACVPSYLLSALWVKPHNVIYIVAGFSAIFQIIGTYFLFKLITGIKKPLQKSFLGKTFLFLLSFVLLCFSLKIVLQALSAIPALADMAYQNKDMVIAYLHLVLIGVASVFVFLILSQEKILDLKSFRIKSGVFLFLSSFVLTEILLFTRHILFGLIPATIPIYYPLLFVLATVMFAGISLIVFRVLIKPGTTTSQKAPGRISGI
jgi:hypothetical protein